MMQLKEYSAREETAQRVVLPVPFGQDYEGERIHDVATGFEAGKKTIMFELLTAASTEQIEDGLITLSGPDIDEISGNNTLPLALLVQVSGNLMCKDYEPVLEHHIHRILNYGHGIMHTGQRNNTVLRISKSAISRGFRLKHLGTILHAGLHRLFGSIVDKVEVNIITNNDEVTDILKHALEIYRHRDARLKDLTDDDTDIGYSCTICQSHAPGHVCIITPEHEGSCGAYSWVDCRIMHDINPLGPSQPVPRGRLIDARTGQWENINEFVSLESGGKNNRYSLYSLITDPAPICECAEAISCILPLCNGIMTVNRAYDGITPSGMTFNRMMELVGGGLSTPGFSGHSLASITGRKFLSAEDGILRLVWMPASLKQAIAGCFTPLAIGLGLPDLIDRIADESIGVTEENTLAFLRDRKHPALDMPPLLG